jgi:phosphate transport system permease protein
MALTANRTVNPNSNSNSAGKDASALAEQASRVAAFGLQDRLFKAVTFSFAALVMLALAGILASLLIKAWPTLEAYGVGFLVGTRWAPNEDVYGAVIAVYGTVVTSGIALAIAVPISFGIAVFLTETCPTWLRQPLGTAIELLAGVPSIIFGFWGLFVFAPIFQEYVQPLLAATQLPLFSGPPMGIGILTASVILALMIIPFIASVMRDVFQTVPPILKESAYGLGCTTWEVVRNIVLPYTRVGVVGGIMLGLGRALGETMAVTFVIGNANRLATSLFAPGNSIASTLANEFAEAAPGLHVSSLFALGLVLFLITFIVLAAAKLLIQAGERAAGSK